MYYCKDTLKTILELKDKDAAHCIIYFDKEIVELFM